jgi:hypothetical protein
MAKFLAVALDGYCSYRTPHQIYVVETVSEKPDSFSYHTYTGYMRYAKKYKFKILKELRAD